MGLAIRRGTGDGPGIEARTCPYPRTESANTCLILPYILAASWLHPGCILARTWPGSSHNCAISPPWLPRLLPGTREDVAEIQPISAVGAEKLRPNWSRLSGSPPRAGREVETKLVFVGRTIGTWLASSPATSPRSQQPPPRPGLHALIFAKSPSLPHLKS